MKYKNKVTNNTRIFFLSLTLPNVMIFCANNDWHKKALEDAKKRADQRAQFDLKIAQASKQPINSQVGIGASKTTQDAIHQHNLKFVGNKK